MRGEPGRGGPDTVLFVTLAAGLGGSARSLLTVLGGLDGRCRRVVARRPATTVAATLDAERAADDVVDLTGRGRGARVVDPWRLVRWAWRHRRELTAVHANGLSELLVAAPAARLAGVPVVAWIHEWEVSPRQRWAARLLARIADVQWTTVSAANRALLHEAGLTGGRPVRIVPNPIEASAPPGPPPSGPGEPTPVTVGFLGTPAAYKGFDLLPAVVDRLAALAPEVRWAVWAGPEARAPEVFAALRRRADRVVLHPKTAEVAEAYAACDVVFCPSRAESFGRVAAEALAHGRAVVASDLPALREVVGDAGVLVPPGQVDAAATALAALAADPARRAALAAAGAERMRRYAPEPVAAALLARYRGDDPPSPAPTGGRGLPARVLVVSHDAARAGAPTVGRRVAQSLAAAGVEVHVALRHGGPLVPELARVATSVRVEPLARARAALRRRTRLRPAVHRLDVLLAARMVARAAPDLVWCNSVMTANHLRAAVEAGIPAVLHSHELGPEVRTVLARYGLDGAAGGVPPDVRLVAAAQGAATRLAGSVGRRPEEVTVLESAVDVADVQRRAAAEPPEHPLPPPGGALVVACGRASHDKGTDLWLAAAARVLAARPATRFVWIGPADEEHPRAAAALGLVDAVRFTGEVADPVPLIARADLFTHPSRVDTFPLVVLEAMAVGRPTVTFDSGGAARQLGDTGVVVPAEDVDAFAGAVLALLDDEARRRSLGAAAERRVRAHFDVAGFDRAVLDVARSAVRDRSGAPEPWSSGQGSVQ